MNHHYGSKKGYPVAKVDHVALEEPLGYSASHPIELSSDEDEYPLTPIMFKTGGKPPNDDSSLRPTIISIEGIPGSGKSDIMNLLAERFKDSTDVLVLQEPSSVWEEIKQEDGTNLMELYFSNQARYGFIFQLAYFMVIERQLRRALRDHSDKRVIICERSLLSARVVFNEMIPVKNRIKYDIYQTLFQKEGVGNVYPDHIILLDTEPRECVGRTSRRDWRGEEVITLEYLQRCRRHHLEMKGRHSGGWTTIKGKPNKSISRMKKIIDTVVSRLQAVAANDQHDIPNDIKLVSLEGNIGAGKSTLLREIEQRCKNRGINEIRILREPVDEWEKVTDGSKTILELFYENPSEYGFPLQILVGITTMNRTHRELMDYPDTKIILSERSSLSSRMVFARMLRQEGFLDDIEYKVYQMLFEGNDKALTYPEMMMYIDTDPITCLSRIGWRDRRGENKITLEELQRCELYHKTMFRQTNIHVRSIETDLEMDGGKLNWTDTIIGWCQQLKSGREPNHLSSPIKENLGKRDWWVELEDSEPVEEQEQSYDISQMDIENLIEPLRLTYESQRSNREELCLLKLKHGIFFYRFALPNWELTNNRVIQEIVRAWPELENKEINLKWKLIEKNNNGKCDDQDLNESLDYIELIDGKEVDRIVEYEIQLQHEPAESECPSNNVTCSGTSGASL